MEKKVSIVVCVYNEEETIEYVLQTCHEMNKDAGIVVVDDGSEDRTPEILKELENEIPMELVTLPGNQGKSNAMAVGAEHAGHEIILFFDADVTGIKQEHFAKLLDPLMEEEPEADMVLGSPSETLINYRVNPFRNLTGERALFKADFLPIVDQIKDIRFGVETYINMYYQAHGKKIKYTILDGLTHPTKYEKTTAAQATREFLVEGQQIAEVLLKNYDLILKRIGTSLEERGDAVKESYRRLQEELNERIQVLLRNNG
ncbi:MAG TPA: glycosyltransferase [Bacteroides sp.]|nr:glycosyltransferase [Bacteroides sp.]